LIPGTFSCLLTATICTWDRNNVQVFVRGFGAVVGSVAATLFTRWVPKSQSLTTTCLMTCEGPRHPALQVHHKTKPCQVHGCRASRQGTRVCTPEVYPGACTAVGSVIDCALPSC
jgi:hypothetical protein